MSFDTSDILGDSLYRTFSRNGLKLLVGVYIASVVGMIGFSSAVFDAAEQVWEDLVAEEPQLADLFDGPEDFLPLALDLPSIVSLFLIALSILAMVVLLAVALRVFHAGLDDELPAEIAFDNIAWVGINLFVGIIIFGFLWTIGLALFLIPGIIVFVLLIYFLTAVSIEDRNFIDAFARSVAVTRGQRLSVFVLFLAVWLIAIAASIAFGIVASFFVLVSPVAGALVEQLAQSVVLLYFAAVVAESYRALTTETDAEVEDTDDDADPFEEFEPASQSAQW